jgi:hypothetical protein
MKKLLTILALITSQMMVYAGGDNLKADKATIDLSAQKDMGKFKADMGVRYNLEKQKIEYLFVKFEMSAGDVVIAAEIAKKTGKPIDEVATCYKKHKGKGWGHTAKEMGVHEPDEYNNFKHCVHSCANHCHHGHDDDEDHHHGHKHGHHKGKGHGKHHKGH